MSNTASASSAGKQLGLFGFFAITASMVMALYEYPTFATSGFSLVFFLLVGGLFWFIPVALCAAEMATVEGWENGGVFAWVSNTLGDRWGFAAISFCYLQIAVGFIPMIYFILGALSYLLAWPELNSDPTIKTIAGLIVIWFLAITQLGGTKYTARIAKTGFIVGIVIPAIALLSLAVVYLTSGAKLEIEMSAATFFPDFTKINTLVVLVAFILSYMGVEASATHINEMKNPNRDYPLAMFMLVIVAIALSSLGGLAIATTIPADKINLSSGIMQAFHVLITSHGKALEWIVRVVAAMLSLGVAAEVTSWIVGPSRGMYVTAQQGILPKFMGKVNKNGVPVSLVAFQLCITTILMIVFTMGGGGSNMSFLIALGLTVVVYLMTYFMLFLGYMHLVLKQKDKKRGYQIPGGTPVKMIISLSGLVVSLIAFFISFFPPSSLSTEEVDRTYVILLVVCYLIIVALPFIIYALHDRRGKKVAATMVPITTTNAPHGHFWLHPKVRATHHIEPTEDVALDQEPRPRD